MANTSYVYLINPTFQFMNVSGKPLVDGYVNLYISGTRSKYYAFSDFEGTLHPFNIPLNALGSAVILVSPAHSYDIYVYNALGTLQMSRYNITPATGEGTVITDVTTLTSKDNTVDITANSSTDYDLSIATKIAELKAYTDQAKNEAIESANTSIAELNDKKKDKQNELTFDGSATKTIKKITQYPNGELNVEFADIDLPQEVPNVEITSEDSSVNITSSVDAGTNTKTFDLSVNVEDAPTFGRFVANNGLTLTKTEGNMTLSSDGKIQLKKGKGYHFTIRGNYYNDTLYNDLRDISFIEYSRNETIPIIVDGTLSTSQAQPFEISFDVAQRTSDLNYGIAFSGLTSNGHITGLRVEVHDINSVSVNGGSGGPINVAHDGTMTGDGTDEMPLSIQSSLDVSNANTAPKYDPTATYPKVGTLCTYNNVLYRSKVAINSAEDWTEEHWEIDSVASELSNIGVWEDISSEFTPTSIITNINRITIKINREIGLLYLSIDVNGNFYRDSSVIQLLFTKSAKISDLRFDAQYGIFSNTSNSNKLEVPYQLSCGEQGIRGWLPTQGMRSNYILVTGLTPFSI